MSLICYPVLETATIKYSVQPGCGFLDDGYYRATKQVHSGCDLNAVTGRDTDYGNRVRAIADGVVVAAGNYEDWGGIVLIWHPELKVWSQSAHLIGIQVEAGQKVQMGDVIGAIGKGEHNQFWAHLHFEIRISELPAEFWASTRFPARAAAEEYIRQHYLDPVAFLTRHGALRTYDEVMTARATRPGVLSAIRQPVPQPQRRWEPVYDPDTNKPIPELYISVRQRADGALRLFRVPRKKLKEEGML